MTAVVTDIVVFATKQFPHPVAGGQRTPEIGYDGSEQK